MASAPAVQATVTEVGDDLAAGARYLEGWPRLLENPYELYLRASDDMRRQMNHAIFRRIWIANDEVIGDELQLPVAELWDVQAFVRLINVQRPTTREASVAPTAAA